MGAEGETVEASKVRVAQYLRMSTEHQKYSLPNQAAAIADYAEERHYEIVRSYPDAGVSGLELKHREALKQLLTDVISGEADFSVILTYDVSRWGRFQDPDQGAHYEYLCREAGVNVEYCAEPFDNDGSVASSLLKNLKRVMAAEYSRELSAKLSTAKHRSTMRGFWVGGPPGYALRRRLVRSDGSLGRILGKGEHRAAQSERTILVPGPPEEVALVRRIFKLFVIDGLNFTGVAHLLNQEGYAAELGARWTLNRVRQIITNEKYIGVNTLGRRKAPLGGRPKRTDRATWTRLPDAFEAIVPLGLFELANANVRVSNRRASDIDLLNSLRRLKEEIGYLSSGAIRAAPYTGCVSSYAKRFGSLTRAYELVDYIPDRRQMLAAQRAFGKKPPVRRFYIPKEPAEELLAQLRKLLIREGRLTVGLINEAADVPNANRFRDRFGGMRRAYALVGYMPHPVQETSLEVCGGQTITREQAREIAVERRSFFEAMEKVTVTDEGAVPARRSRSESRLDGPPPS